MTDWHELKCPSCGEPIYVTAIGQDVKVEKVDVQPDGVHVFTDKGYQKLPLPNNGEGVG